MYQQLLTPSNLALLHDWLAQDGMLYLDVYHPHTGSSGTGYLIRSLRDVKHVLSQQQRPELCLTFLREPFQLRGVAAFDLLAKAQQLIPDGTPFWVADPHTLYPEPCLFFDHGESHAELKAAVEDVWDMEVGIGVDVLSLHDQQWLYSHPQRIFVVSVTRNQSSYQPYAENPEQYHDIVGRWNEADEEC